MSSMAKILRMLLFLSTPSARRATLTGSILWSMLTISIHALREEGDAHRSENHHQEKHFYPRPPRGGRPYARLHNMTIQKISIHALREEGDPKGSHRKEETGDFYPRPPRGGRPYKDSGVHTYLNDFYPRPPRGGRRPRSHGGGRRMCISIHALREEGDATSSMATTARSNFYPRPPRGGRLRQ